jgi:hypothetical protein
MEPEIDLQTVTICYTPAPGSLSATGLQQKPLPTRALNAGKNPVLVRGHRGKTPA